MRQALTPACLIFFGEVRGQVNGNAKAATLCLDSHFTP